MTRARWGGLLVGAVCSLALTAGSAGPALAEIKVVTHRQGPVVLKPYEVRYTTKALKNVPAPGMDGFVVGMHARVVDSHGRQIPVRRVMLHHIVYKDAGRHLGERHDPVCGGRAESFYGTGEENESLRLPPHYGYSIHKGDRWQTGWMLMNHKNRTERAYIEYTARIDTSKGLAPVRPYWARATGCGNAIDPIFTVPGGGPPGSLYTISSTFKIEKPGLLIAAGAHAHGGAKAVGISQPGCGNRLLIASRPTYGLPSHPYYHVLPVLHEPGPINMSWWQTGLGIPVGEGETLRVGATYDGEMPHVRAMGIMHLYVHEQEDVQSSCDPPPDDVLNVRTSTAGRSEPPRITVPLTGLDSSGGSHTILRPPVPLRRFGGNVSVDVRDFSYSKRYFSIPLGSTVRWRFHDSQQHNATLANGPFGFASPSLRKGGSYSERFTKPGVYRVFCSLHPVDLTQAIVVRR